MDVSYRLKAGLRWSDGQPITARDVAFTWRALVDPHSQGYLDTAGYRAISRIDIRDDLHLTLRFDRVYPEYLTLFPAVLPEHRLRDVAFAELPTNAFWARPDVVSGPYKVSELVPDEHITLVRNLAWSQGRGGARPHLDTIIYKVYPEAGQLIDAARKGEVALALEIPDGELSGLGTLDKVSLLHRASLAYEQVTFNQADPNSLTGQPPVWKGDPLLLKALRMAVDREALNRTLLGGQAELADSPIPSALTQYQGAGLAPVFDARQATQLLDSDGWALGADGVRTKAGRRLSFSLTTAVGDPLRLAVRDRLIADWQRIGVQVAPSEAHPSQLFGGYAQGGLLEHGSFEAGLWTWSIGPDPDGVYALEHSSEIPTDSNQGQGSNFGRFASQDIDHSLDRGRGSLLTDQRVQAYSAFERAYNDLGAELPLYQRVLSVLATPHLHNVLPNPAPDTTFWNVADWWVDA
jgi:peptide/nickel transport system substrate-binding protein